MVLVDDYSSVIKDGRREKGMSQDDLAKRLNEKKSIIAKLENGDMRPSDKLIKKLEKELGIRLRESAVGTNVGTSQSSSGGLTIADILKNAKRE